MSKIISDKSLKTAKKYVKKPNISCLYDYFDLTPTLESAGLGALGLCLTKCNIEAYFQGDNATKEHLQAISDPNFYMRKEYVNMVSSRFGTPIENKALKIRVDSVIEKLLQNPLFLGATYCYERHRNGILHSHLMLFFPIELYDKATEFLEKTFGERAVSESLYCEYLYKTMSDGNDMTAEFISDNGKPYNTAKIKGVQNEKKIYFKLSENAKETPYEAPLLKILNTIYFNFLSYKEAHKKYKRSEKNKEKPVLIQVKKNIINSRLSQLPTNTYEATKKLKKVERDLKKGTQRRAEKKDTRMTIAVKDKDGNKVTLKVDMQGQIYSPHKRRKTKERIQRKAQRKGVVKAKRLAKEISIKNKKEVLSDPYFYYQNLVYAENDSYEINGVKYIKTAKLGADNNSYQSYLNYEYLSSTGERLKDGIYALNKQIKQNLKMIKNANIPIPFDMKSWHENK